MTVFSGVSFKNEEITLREGDVYYGCVFENCSIFIEDGAENAEITNSSIRNCGFEGVAWLLAEFSGNTFDAKRH